MMNTINQFWNENKDTIKNVALVVTTTVAAIGVMAIYGINKEGGLNDFLKQNDLFDKYYNDPDEDGEA